MTKLNIQLLLSLLVSTSLLMSGAASAETIKRSSSRLETIEAPRTTINRKQSQIRSSSSSTSSRSSTASTPSSNVNRRTTTIRKPSTSYKPATSTYQKPQRSYKPITTIKPTVNKYRPPVNNSQPAVNAYRPPVNAYKPPVINSRPTTSSTYRPVFPKPSVSTGIRRTDERDQEHEDSAAHNNRNTIRPYRPWNSIFNNRYDPSRHQNWYSNAGHRFPIEHSYNVWSNSYGQAYRPGYSTSYLPSYYDRFSWNNTPYYSYGGLYFSYNRGNSHFSLVSAPIGYRLNTLPQHSIGFYHGNDLYFNAYDNYYRWLPTSREYIIVDRPLYDDEYDDESYATSEDSYHVNYNDGAPIYYPAAGQNEAQMSLDLDECHIWSAKETNFDPSIPYPSYDEYKAEGFGLALEACMTSRGYTVL